jgi:hypothetical protein
MYCFVRVAECINYYCVLENVLLLVYSYSRLTINETNVSLQEIRFSNIKQ